MKFSSRKNTDNIDVINKEDIRDSFMPDFNIATKSIMNITIRMPDIKVFDVASLTELTN